jgi:hypothetical protein
VPVTNYKTIFRADFKPDLGFYDKLFQMASELPGYKDWVTTGLAVTLQDFDERCSFSLAHNFFVYVRDMKPQDNSKFDDDRIKEIVDKIPSRLKLTRFQRIGLRSWFLNPVKMKFEELVFVANEKFLVHTKEIREAISSSPTDVAYSIHFDERKLKVALRAGPMKREEVEAQFVPDRNSNFAVKERALPTEELFEDFPAVALLIDIDASQSDVAADDLGKFLTDAQALQAKLSENIVKYVLGLAPKGK